MYLVKYYKPKSLAKNVNKDGNCMNLRFYNVISRAKYEDHHF